MSFYRKYRPATINDLDLENVRASIYNLSAHLDSIPQAFLFSGPRGAGKTSAARIIAKLVNCEKPVKVGEYLEPCNKCDHCLSVNSGSSMDVVEIDAASNRGIDDIRTLRESVNLSPANSKYKVYILDEAHMLTTEAANAFLKTLEEPPAHAIFILATTEPEKLPETVHSRLTKINFRKATLEEISRQLARVALSENIELNDEVLKIISKKSDGSFRDAVKILESLVSENKGFDEKTVGEILLSTQKINYSEFLDTVVSRDLDKSLEILSKYVSEGGSVKDLIERLTEDIRLMLVSGESISKTESLKALHLLLEARENLKKTHMPQIALEIMLAEWGEFKDKPKAVENIETSDVKKKEIAKLDELSWARILSSVREKNASIEALLRAAKPIGVTGDVFNLGVYYRFHKERLETAELKRTLEDVVEEVLGGPLKLVCSLEEKKTPSISERVGLTQPADKDIISAAKEIFG